MDRAPVTFSEKAISTIVMGLPVPVILMLTFWWGSIPFWTDDYVIMFHAFFGLALGLILDAIVLRKYLVDLFYMSYGIQIALFMFYSILVYGFFMGFPVFNALVGIAFSYLVTKGAISSGLEMQIVKRLAGKYILSSTIMLLILCLFTAWLALGESTITDQIEGMLGLGFEVSMQMVWSLIIVGGVALLLFQYVGSRYVAKAAISNYMRSKTLP